MKQHFESVKGILLKDGLRKAGSFTTEKGELKEYGECYQVIILPVGSANGKEVRKYAVAETCVDNVKNILSETNWGAYISLDFTEGKISNVTVIDDFFGSYSDNLQIF